MMTIQRPGSFRFHPVLAALVLAITPVLASRATAQYQPPAPKDFVSSLDPDILRGGIALPLSPPLYPGFRREEEQADREARRTVRIGSRLLVVSPYRGLVVFDLASSELLPVAEIPLEGEPFDVWRSGDRLYVLLDSVFELKHDAGGEVRPGEGCRVVVFDVSEVDTPQVMGSWEGRGRFEDARLVEGRLVTVSRIAGCDPLSPGQGSGQERTVLRILDSLRSGSPVTAEQRFLAGQHRCQFVGNRLVVFQLERSGTSARVFDVADRDATLSREGRIRFDEQLFLYSQPRGLVHEIEGNLVFVTRGDEEVVVHTVAVQEDGSLARRGELRVPEGFGTFTGVFFHGKVGYLVRHSNAYQSMGALQILDLSRVGRPRLGELLPFPGSITDWTILEDRLVVLGHGKAFRDPGAFDPWPERVEVVGRTDRSFGVFLLGLEDPLRPRWLDRLRLGWGRYDSFEHVVRDTGKPDFLYVPTYFRTNGRLVEIVNRRRLFLRGGHPGGTEVRRLFRRGDFLVGATDRAVFRTEVAPGPIPTRTREFARDVLDTVFLGDHAVQLARPERRFHEVDLVVTPRSAPDAIVPVTKISLPARTAYSLYFPTIDEPPRILVDGSFAYLVGEEDGEKVLTVLDLTDPGSPAIRGRLTLPYGSAVRPWFGYDVDQMMETRDEIVQVAGSILVFHQLSPFEPWGPYESSARFVVVDASDPDRPVVASIIQARSRDAFYPFVSGTTLYFAHYEPLPGENPDAFGRIQVRFYLNEYDLSDPHRPRDRGSINIPGRPLRISPDGRTVVTLDEQGLLWPPTSSLWSLRLGRGLVDSCHRVSLGFASPSVRAGRSTIFALERSTCGSRIERPLSIFGLDERGRFRTPRRPRLPFVVSGLKDAPRGRVVLGVGGAGWWLVDAESSGGLTFLDTYGRTPRDLHVVEDGGSYFGVAGLHGVDRFDRREVKKK